MFKFFARRRQLEQEANLLWYKLAQELQRNGCPMPREQLISWYEHKYGHDLVIWTINRMVDVDLIAEQFLFFNDGEVTQRVLSLALMTQLQPSELAA